MSKNCKGCPHGSGNSPDPCSDVCDGCQNDPDTGWGGFTDHSLGKHFYNEEERRNYIKEKNLLEDESDEVED